MGDKAALVIINFEENKVIGIDYFEGDKEKTAYEKAKELSQATLSDFSGPHYGREIVENESII
jgi:hypothetical protein